MTENAKLAAALVAALEEITVIDKGRKANAGSYTYEYASIEDVVKLTRPVLAKNGIVALTPVHDHGNGLACTVVFLHTSGERMDLGPFPFPHGRDAQATGSMVTYHRRYALVSALGIAIGDDDDGAKAVARPEQAQGGRKADAAPPAPPSEFVEVFNELDPAVKNKVLPWLREQGHKPSTVPEDLMPAVFEFIATLEVSA